MFVTDRILLDDKWLAGGDIAEKINWYFVNSGGEPTKDVVDINFENCSESPLTLKGLTTKWNKKDNWLKTTLGWFIFSNEVFK